PPNVRIICALFAGAQPHQACWDCASLSSSVHRRLTSVRGREAHWRYPALYSLECCLGATMRSGILLTMRTSPPILVARLEVTTRISKSTCRQMARSSYRGATRVAANLFGRLAEKHQPTRQMHG